MLDHKEDELSQIAAIWILASNDEDSIITYKGIADRLGININTVQSLINRRRELFRLGASQDHIDGLKRKLGSLQLDRMPAWLQKISNDIERNSAIENINYDSVFRSQFRTQDRAPKSPLEIVEWGLRHLDSLRKAEGEKQEKKFKNWQSLFTLLSLLLALSSLASTFYLQNKNISTQKEMKILETTFKPKQEAYSQFMYSVYDAYMNARVKDFVGFQDHLHKIELEYYILEPFLDEYRRKSVWNQNEQFSAMCRSLIFESDTTKFEGYDSSFRRYQEFFHENLYPALFDKSH